MVREITLQELVAVNNPKGGAAVLNKYSYPAPKSTKDLVIKLNHLTKSYREQALSDLAEVHPHRDLILHYDEPKAGCGVLPISADEKKSNCGGGSTSSAEGGKTGCGCGGACGGSEKKSNFSSVEEAYAPADGSGQKTMAQKFNEYIPLIVVAGLFALGIMALSGKKA